MIPVSLTIQGIYSYQTKQTIDFTKLTAAGIFGIFGPVGSGKSTVIEAISYALYGRTDRLNLSGDNRNYNMMNLKSNEMLIEFVFKAGRDHQEYMALVRSRRNSKQFDDVKLAERTAYLKVNGEWKPTEVEKLEKAIGLSYDNFKRTVIIPQGKFQEFLLLGNKERTLMMKELFNLEKFELYYKAATLESKAVGQMQNIEGQLQQLAGVTAEAIEGVEASFNSIRHDIEIKSQELAKKQEEESLQRKLRELRIKADKINRELLLHKEQENEIAILESKIAGFEYCNFRFSGLLKDQNAGVTKVAQIKTELSNDETRLTDITSKLADLEKSFEEIRVAFENRELLKNKAEELSKIARILELERQQKNLEERIRQGEKYLSATGQTLQSQLGEQEKLSSEIKELKANYPDMGLLAKVKDWHTVNAHLLKSAKEIDAEWNSLKNEMDELLQQKVSLFNSACFVGLAVSDSYDNIIAQLEDKKLTHSNAVEVLNLERQHYLVQQKLEQYASELEEGKPCPLCGATSHPQILNAANISETLGNITRETAVHEKSMVLIDQGMKRFTEINTLLCLKEESVSKILRKQKDQQTEYSAHQNLFQWNGYKDEEAVKLAFAKAEELQLLIAKKESELEQVRVKLETETKLREKYSKGIDDLRNQITQATTETNILKSQLRLLQLADYQPCSPETIKNSMEQLLKQYQETEVRYQNSLHQLNNFRKEKDTLSGRMEANRKTLEKELETLSKVGNEIDAQLKLSRYAHLDEIKQILSWNPDLEKEKLRISNFRRDFDLLAKQLTDVNTEIGNREFNEEHYQALLSTIEKMAGELKNGHQLLGKLNAELSKLRVDLVTKTKLVEQQEGLEKRLENLKTLKQLFKGGGFVNYISSVYLHELCHSANERFYKLTGQKLSLEVNSENNFEVRDFMNGGKLRSVKTLSGGQTFQAALSLALALSDNTRKIAGSDENFFFLDEGFGSLDKESLEIVFDTLKALRRENRIVGVISHVEEMQQEIDVHLRIQNHEDSGSVIEKSW